MEEKYAPEVKTTGERQVFDTGAQRDTQKNKGRFDLIPYGALEFVAEQYARNGKCVGVSLINVGKAIGLLYKGITKDNAVVLYVAEAVYNILEFMEKEDNNTISYVDPYNSFSTNNSRYDLIPYSSLKRVADLYEKGANEYGERNWEKGMPLTRFLDSAIRHLFQRISSEKDEDHLAAGCWNAMGYIEILRKINGVYLPKKLDNRVELTRYKEDVIPENNISQEDYIRSPALQYQKLMVEDLEKAPIFDGYGCVKVEKK